MAFIGNQPFTAAFLTDTFSGNGSTVAFTMTVAPANTSSIIVAVTGVLQDPSTYSVSGTTLTFSAAPPSGTSNISVRYLGIPASGVTTTAYRTVTNTTATAGQTSFTIPSYTVGYVDVYRNGVYLPTSDYTATTGTTVVLTNAATVGDTITTISFYVSSVLNAIPATAGSVSSSYIVAGAVGTTQIASSVTLTTPTLTSPTITGAVVSSMASSVITSGTAQASTSGTSINFTSIPSWVKRVNVMFSGVSTSGTSVVQIQLGTGATPTYTTSGYTCAANDFVSSPSGTLFTSGFATESGGAAAYARSGQMIISNITGNTWVESSLMQQSTATARNSYSGGGIALAAALTAVRITTVNGTDTFDAGTINILYE
jgi:hypothetical protein